MSKIIKTKPAKFDDVQIEAGPRLFVPRSHGKHCLDGQLADDGDTLVGSKPSPTERSHHDQA